MFKRISDFIEIWEMESQATLNVLEQLTDSSLNQSVVPGGRTLGRLANHIIETLTEMPHKLHLGIEEEKPDLKNVQDIVHGYKIVEKNFLNALRTKWNDETLTDQTVMYGETWTNSFALWVLVAHQIHHRSQMTILMRQAGLKVPGTFGPAREEWESMGLQALP
jgi:uncharacterized damage-inducible protein DinB